MPREMKIPPRAVPENDNGYFEILTKVIFRRAFAGRLSRTSGPASKRRSPASTSMKSPASIRRGLKPWLPTRG